MKGQLERGDIMQTAIVDGHVRVNVGDQVEGKGYTASRPLWIGPGFRSRPNPPTSTGAAQALFVTLGNDRVILAARDARFTGPFGDLGEGDCEIVSDCDAGFRLDKASNAVRLSSTGVDVVVDGSAGTVTISKGGVTATFADAALSLVFNPASLPTPPAAIVLSATGVAITSTGPVTVNGTPLVVP